MNAAPGSEDRGSAPRRRWSTLVLGACAGLVFLSLIGLGSWQVWRLQWKNDLIARVAARVHAPAVSAPERSHWAGVTAQADEYRHVSIRGTFLHERTTRVQASTVLGSGFWLLTPLRAENGDVVLINRGYAAARASDWQPHTQHPDLLLPLPGPTEPGARTITVTGLLRISETGGAFLRRNDAANGRWYARDIEAIAAAQALGAVAPYFIDADADPLARTAPRDAGAVEAVGGLTVIAFPNNHLAYALCWFTMALALMMALALTFVSHWRQRGKW